MVEKTPKIAKKLPKAREYKDLPKLTEAIDALLRTPYVATAKAKTVVEELYAMVVQEPQQVANIEVWADALLEAGDDRGTFVAHQLMAETQEPNAKQQKAQAQLLKKNRLAWLGQAGSVIEAKTATFRRGLLDSAVLKRKAKDKDLQAPEFRTVTQLGTESVALLAHENLVSLTRLGRSVVPNQLSTTGPVGCDYFEDLQLSWEQTATLPELKLSGVTHLETHLPKDLNVEEVIEALPDLKSVLLAYQWSLSIDEESFYQPLMPWLRTMSDVFIGFSLRRDDWFVDQLPTSNVHFTGYTVHRSYMRRDGELHAILTDPSSKGGFLLSHQHNAHNLRELHSLYLKFLETVPSVDSICFRQRTSWNPLEVDAVAKRTQHLRNVTLPKAKKLKT